MAPKTENLPSDKEVIALIKKEVSIPQAAAQLKTTSSVMANLYYRLEPVADPSLVIKGSPKAVAKAIVDGREEGLRWERLAHRADKPVSEIKEIWESTTGEDASNSYTGRGRKYGNNGATTTTKTKAKTGKTASTATAGNGRRRGGAAAKAPAKARTRAERAKKTGNPS